MKLRYTRTAARQIEDALDYVMQHSPQGARSVHERLMAATEILRVYPKAGQLTDRPGVRRLVLSPYPYVLFYRLVQDDLVILRFRHAAQRPLRS